MDKKIIVSILKNGFSDTKKNIEQITPGLPFLNKIFSPGFGGVGVMCNKNAFWDVKNIHNRIDLIRDIEAANFRAGIKGKYFDILNRFQNGDKYGII